MKSCIKYYKYYSYFTHFSFLVPTRNAFSFLELSLWQKGCQQKWLLSIPDWCTEFLQQELGFPPCRVAPEPLCGEEGATRSKQPGIWAARGAAAVGRSPGCRALWARSKLCCDKSLKCCSFLLQCNLVCSDWHKISSGWDIRRRGSQ